jgi:hypothetical protein
MPGIGSGTSADAPSTTTLFSYPRTIHCALTYSPTYAFNASTPSTKSHCSRQKLPNNPVELLRATAIDYTSRIAQTGNMARKSTAKVEPSSDEASAQSDVEMQDEQDDKMSGFKKFGVSTTIPRTSRVQEECNIGVRYRSAQAFARSCPAQLLTRLRKEAAAPGGRPLVLRSFCNMRARLPLAA